MLWEEKQRQDFIGGFKLGRLADHRPRLLRGRAGSAERRLLREYADTCARFGTDIDDLAPYVVRRGDAAL